MERKFTDDEIVKALEICSKNNVTRHNELTYEGIPLRFLFEDTFDLIKRKNEEVHCLTDALDNSTKEFLKLHDEYQKQKAEIERLEKTLTEQFDSYESIRKRTKSDAIKEFAERLKLDLGDVFLRAHNCVESIIDNLVKEMTGEDNGN